MYSAGSGPLTDPAPRSGAVAPLLARIDRMQAALDAALARVAELEARLNPDMTNEQYHAMMDRLWALVRAGNEVEARVAELEALL